MSDLGYGIVNLSIIPVRTEPSHKSELSTQLLFGEVYKVLNKSADNGWLYIENQYDNYKGWIDKGQFSEISAEDFKTIANQQEEILNTKQTLSLRSLQNQQEILVVLGAKLNYSTENRLKNGEKYHFELLNNEKKEIEPPLCNLKENILEKAFLFLNAPYLWGGKTPFGTDCSGFTQQIMRLNHIKIKRDACQQAEQGTKIKSIQESTTGDLAFFVRNNRVVHVGLIIEDKDLFKNKPNFELKPNERWIMHALECVRIDKLDEKGIFNIDKKNYSHFLHSLKRFF